jgi:hypothetical protein
MLGVPEGQAPSIGNHRRPLALPYSSKGVIVVAEGDGAVAVEATEVVEGP